MVVRPWVMLDAAIDFFVRVSSSFGAELPDSPVLSMLLVKEGDELR